MGIEIYLILILLGLVIGSFVSAVTYRMPRGQQFSSGRSHCDSCNKDLKWYDNIPLFFFLIYNGKSRCCGKKISIRYPFIELSSAFGAILTFHFFGSSLSQFALSYMLYVICLTIVVIDIEHQIIPDELSWLLLLYALCFMPYGLGLTPYSYLFSGFLYSSLFLFLYLVTLGRGMGLGDVKLAIPLGLWLGLERGLTWFAFSFIIGGIFATILLLLKRAKLKTKIAFGPFMLVAFWMVLLFEKI